MSFINIKCTMLLGMLLLSLAPTSPGVETALKVAFIGNSFTEYQDLPGKFKNLAIADGRPAPITGKSIYLGHSLENQWIEKKAQVTGLIKQTNWDYIVLQDHSTQTYARSANFEQYAKIYTDYIHANCPSAKIVWFLTWARFETSLKTSTDILYGNAMELDKQHIIADGYMKMANLHGDILVPAGIALDLFRQRNNYAWNLSLTRSETDMNHVNANGTYLAACTFFAKLYNKTPVGLPKSSDVTLTAAQVTVAQQCALTAANGLWDQRIFFKTNTTQNYTGTPIAVPLQAKSTSGLQPVITVVSGPATLGATTFTPWKVGTTAYYANWAKTTLTITGPGTVVLSIKQTGNSNYAAAQVVTQSITVSGSGTPTNQAPVVNAGADKNVILPSAITLTGVVSDDGLPSPINLTQGWSKISGPGTVTFTAATAATTSATFSVAGTYVVRLTANDSALSSFDEATVIVTSGTSTTQSVSSLTLVNADTDVDIGPMVEGMVIDFSVIGTSNLSVRANTTPSTVGSVRFTYDSTNNLRTENSAPYSIAGDAGSNYHPWIPTVGAHLLTVTPYTGTNASGTKGTGVTVHFTVETGVAPLVPAVAQ